MLDEPLFLDYETRCEIDLPRFGARPYVPRAEVMMAGTARGDAEPVIRDRVLPEQGPFISWGRFDYKIFAHHESPGYPSEQWIDAMALAYYIGFPPGLNAFCSAIGIANKKDPRGTRLINLYCLPQEDGTFREWEGDDREAMEEYCLQDVRLLQKAWHALRPLHDEWERIQRPHYEMVERMNDRGMPIDRVACGLAIKSIQKQERELVEEFRQLTGFNPTQGERLRVFLGTKDVTAQTLRDTEFTDPDQDRAAVIRLTIARAATKKLVPMYNRSIEGERAYDCFIDHGAHTGRATSRDIQMHNLKRGKTDYDYFYRLLATGTSHHPLKDAQQNIRGFICAPEGRTLVVSDYSQIEPRVLAWLAGDEKMLAAFMSGLDVYQMFVAKMMGSPERWRHVTGKARSLGKLAILGCGYGVSGGGLAAQAPAYGLRISADEGAEIVQRYARICWEVGQLRTRLMKAAIRVVEGKARTDRVAGCRFHMLSDTLVITLPSGRKLRYWRPERSGEAQLTCQMRLGRNMVAKKVWPGLLIENICQAIATDVKLHHMHLIEEAGYALIAEVHDEVIVETDEDEAKTAQAEIERIMCISPSWFPDGLLQVESWIGRRYSK